MVAGYPTGESARRSGASFSRVSHILAVYEENGVFDVFVGLVRGRYMSPKLFGVHVD